jgi:hypothetical protein
MDRSTVFRAGVCPALLAVCAALTGCGSGDGFDQGAGGAVPLAPTYESVQANIFTPVCEQCHSGATAPAGLRLDAANAYTSLVNVASRQQPGTLRVRPGDPDNSYIVHKVEGRAAAGERMPAGLPPLPQADIDAIRGWIAAGALPGSQSSGPVRVTSLVPAPASAEVALPASITAVFDRQLNAPSVTTATFVLQRSGGDGSFGDGNEVAVTPVSVTVPSSNVNSAIMDLTGVASVNDTYRVTLLGSGPATILDLGGNALDGEFSGTFPSGNGAPGGDFLATFAVSNVQPTLTSIQSTVFGPVCSGCHRGGGATLPTSIDLRTAASSYAALVNVVSTQMPPLQRVTPGNPADSYLVRKIEGGPNIAGLQMPRNAPPLDQPTISAIRQWISNGAPQ